MQETRLLETLKVIDGNYLNLKYHQWRVDWSRKRLGYHNQLIFSLPTPPKNGIYRARVLYSKEIDEVQFIPYPTKKIDTLSLAYSDNIDYSLKYENREEIDRLKLKYQGDSDDILIIKNGLITDTSIANIALFDGRVWVTPKKPLLRGTTRERLIQEKRLVERDIKISDISNFKEIALMNALIGFYKIDGIDLVKLR